MTKPRAGDSSIGHEGRSPRARRDIRRRLAVPVQRYVAIPVGSRVARYFGGLAVLETIGRRSGQPRRTPIGGRLVGSSYWFVSEFGRDSQYVRNIIANPKVRLQIRGVWRDGTAVLLDDDDARARLRTLNRLNSSVVRTVGSNLLTIRIDLD
ncbi:nitroreductase/quinone reductase family protein [Nocardia africana]|uniref:Deazaflavin-dependent oxidoreductase, nitroreductase family n=1 Tax=Nocardia africana TaxID=134964 RepID=A0A378X5R4_9NOCA|nr:nitroreductase/quinone reductase family protein [Nocardia africana]MCC3317713.1 nitroreductase family deazaflavin-dependent oxidoreductase [Nocardia africana]SUA48472.1 deazaflavin-dependent oxidoreductase, nitroreductase family [Nocardia africana]